MTTRILVALALAALLGASAEDAAADDPKLPGVKSFDKAVIDSLRDVHNKGADLYNTAKDTKDYLAAYRMYEGAILAVRPLLAHRPEAQKLIDDGLAAAEKESDAARKAFLLHESIEAVRKYLKIAISPPKQPEEKKPEDKKPEEKKPKAPTSTTTATVTGVITLNAKPLAGAEVVFASLDPKQPKMTKVKTNDDGTYALAGALPAGKYGIAVTGTGVPDKFKSAETSGLVIELKDGKQMHNFDLK